MSHRRTRVARCRASTSGGPERLRPPEQLRVASRAGGHLETTSRRPSGSSAAATWTSAWVSTPATKRYQKPACADAESRC